MAPTRTLLFHFATPTTPAPAANRPTSSSYKTSSPGPPSPPSPSPKPLPPEPAAPPFRRSFLKWFEMRNATSIQKSGKQIVLSKPTPQRPECRKKGGLKKLTQTLLKIQPWITKRLNAASVPSNPLKPPPPPPKKKKPTYLIPQPQLLLPKLHAAPHTLRNTKPLLIKLARELKRHASEARPVRRVDAQARRQLCYDRPKVPRLEARG
ncbi:hypothetical protein D9615_010485 [Tricholomella constricta]|uniref:Uncharacterized protein n=1 Tax=Tricholomella constricta TaxID=117010 RepID=A0A8H5GNA7_9AGAR|nr:hypothetical protein D9615_010485 [Tricholomella constricta]